MLSLSKDQPDSWQLVGRTDEYVDLVPRNSPLRDSALTLRIALEHRYTVSLSLRSSSAAPDIIIRLTPPSVFHRPPDSGFTGAREAVLPIAVRGNSVISRPQPANLERVNVDLSADEHERIWVGFRNRFWALLGHVDGPYDEWKFRPAETSGKDFWETRLAPNSRLTLYAGPLDPDALASTDPALTHILFSGLWSWMRWLCLAMLAALTFLAAVFQNWGIAIIGLAAVVKLLMTPLSRIAAQWQAKVNQIQSELQPRIDAIKRDYSGEEQSSRILAAHKELGVTPFYTFRSTLGFLIQIPVFIAAFNVLNEAVGLNGAEFLWIDDLARPDHFAPLPFRVPFFGGHLNLLPVLMTGITVFAARALRDANLSDALRSRHRVRLYWMALFFFFLFYTFPAGMVLYWTTNTLLQALSSWLPRRSRL